MARYDPSLPWTLEAESRHRGSVSGKVQVVFQLVIAVIYAWYCWHFPPPGKALLWLTLAAILMTLSQVGPFHKAVWVVLVLVLMFLENKSINNDQLEASNRDQRAINNATVLVRQMSIIAPQVVLTNTKLGMLQDEQRVAKIRNDEKKAALVRGEIAKVQNQADAAVTRLLLTMAPAILGEMRSWADRWDMQDRDIEKRYLASIQPGQSKLPPERANLDEHNTREVLPLIRSADYLRESLLNRGPNYELTQQDRQAAAIFNKALAGQSINWGEMRVVSDYMDKLTRTFTSLYPN